MTLARLLLPQRYDPPTRFCPKCSQTLPLDAFQPKATCWCRKCDHEAGAKWRATQGPREKFLRRLKQQPNKLRTDTAYRRRHLELFDSYRFDNALYAESFQRQLDPREEIELQEMSAFAPE